MLPSVADDGGGRKKLSSARFGRFAVVGIFGTIVYAAVAWMLTAAFAANTMTATSISFVVVVALNYVLHYQWTFSSRKQHVVAVAQFAAASFLGFTVNFLAVYVGVVVWKFAYLAVQIPALFLVVASNFLLSALWVFSGPGKTRGELQPPWRRAPAHRINKRRRESRLADGSSAEGPPS